MNARSRRRFVGAEQRRDRPTMRARDGRLIMRRAFD
jgi:hypothetical protein